MTKSEFEQMIERAALKKSHEAWSDAFIDKLDKEIGIIEDTDIRQMEACRAIERHGFKAGAQFVLDNLDKIKSVKRLIEAAERVTTINIEYQADKNSGPYDMVYVKWKAEKELRYENLRQALEQWRSNGK